LATNGERRSLVARGDGHGELTAADDQTVGYQGSIDLFGAWRKAGLPAELHVFQTGQHGFGKKGGGADHYLDRVEEWMKLNGWLTKVSK
jgi:dipeptidyl aminopeptidase/acylaminoacyl peptidase